MKDLLREAASYPVSDWSLLQYNGSTGKCSNDNRCDDQPGPRIRTGRTSVVMQSVEVIPNLVFTTIEISDNKVNYDLLLQAS